MADLSDKQRKVIELDGDVFVTACPGSGKTRVLTEKIVFTLQKGIPAYQRIAAVTFTNHAAGEIASRLQESGYSRKQLWTGTIHSFALDLILRPYASYHRQLKRGFGVADEFHARKVLENAADDFGVTRLNELRTGFDRNGELLAQETAERQTLRKYRRMLEDEQLIDFDTVLYFAFSMLRDTPEISRTLGAIFNLICIDEYQDTQDLQFGILSLIVRASQGKTRLFIVGDKNQAIYTSLGGIAKSIQEIKDEFDRQSLLHRELTGNYRSTQRIVDYCSQLGEFDGEPVSSLAEYAQESGLISFANQTVHFDALAASIGKLVTFHLGRGVKPQDICILAPRWSHLTEMGRALLLELPDVDIDAPGLSPLKYQPDSLWFKLARLILTEPSPTRYRSRLRWASEFVLQLEASLGRELPEEARNSRTILRLLNSLKSVQDSGLAYLDDIFEQFLSVLEIDVSQYRDIQQALDSFFEGAEARLIEQNNEMEPIETLKRMFRYPTGVIVNTCHGSKGDEYEVVICFGLLRGYVPNWSRIFDDAIDDAAEARRILYVIASRAKRFIHLISEDGRVTTNHNPYETTRELHEVVWSYDISPG